MISIIWIYMISNELVGLLKALGIIFNISAAIVGVILAIGNSITDFIADIVVAKKGMPQMAVAACHAGPLFNLLVGLGISLTWVCIEHWPTPFSSDLNIKIYVAFLALIISLVSTFIYAFWNNFTITRKFGIYLLGVFFCFDAALVTIEILKWDPKIPRWI